MSGPEVTLLGRPGCHLCEEAMAVLEGLRSELGSAAFELRTVDIEADDATFKAYLERIPVIEVDGEEICELGLDAGAVRAVLGTVSA